MIQKNFSMNLIVAALVATFSLLFASAPEAAEPNRVVIEINALKFAPQKPVLGVGDVVIWKNNDIVPHTATALDGSWDSGTIEPGAQWQTTVTAKMLTGYFCQFHPMMAATLAAKSTTAKR